jgi:hypothetical protein
MPHGKNPSPAMLKAARKQWAEERAAKAAEAARDPERLAREAELGAIMAAAATVFPAEAPKRPVRVDLAKDPAVKGVAALIAAEAEAEKQRFQAEADIKRQASAREAVLAKLAKREFAAKEAVEDFARRLMANGPLIQFAHGNDTDARDWSATIRACQHVRDLLTTVREGEEHPPTLTTVLREIRASLLQVLAYEANRMGRNIPFERAVIAATARIAVEDLARTADFFGIPSEMY